MIRAVLFDLDGTLVNTLDDIASVVNAALESSGHAIHPVESYKTMVGDGFRMLVERALPSVDERERERVFVRAFAAYEALGPGSSLPYEGIRELLAALKARGIAMAVVTNKPDAVTARVVEGIFPERPFGFVRGTREGFPRKPDPVPALEAAAALGASPGDCLFLGDSDVDMLTAVNAGMFPAGAAWGYRSREELAAAGASAVVERPLELLRLLPRLS